MKRRARGFTIIELMVVTIIVISLVALAVPSFSDFIVDSRMTGQTNDFLTMVNFTRSEAVKRNARVTMCRSANGTTCAVSGGWEQGWIAFTDGSVFGTLDGADALLRVHAALTPGDTLVGSDDVSAYISFIPDGRSILDNGAAQAGTINLCVSGATMKGRQVTLALGRAQTAKIDCPVS